MKRIQTLIAIILVAVNINALPEWSRKYATTVVRGHVTRLPESTKHFLATYGGVSDENIKGDMMPEMYDDSTGVFSIKWKTCWPITTMFDVCGIRINLPLTPGDTVDIEMDYPKAQELKEDTERLFQEAITIRGTFIPLSSRYMALYRKLNNEANFFNTDYLKEHCRVNFNAYREWQWEGFLKRLKEVNTSKMNKQEKEFLRQKLENSYISSLYSFDMLMGFIGCDSAEMAAVKQQFTAVDPHARSLTFPKSVTNAFYFHTGVLKYLEANGLDNLPLGRYLKERKQAEELLAQIKAFRAVSSNDIDNLSPEFQQPLHELKTEMAEKIQQNINWQPTGEPSTWLRQIVDRHKGHVVYIDYWATWCGPCNKGINEMATVKDKYEKLGVDFVYITDNTSSTDGFLDMKQKHSGDHFLFTRNDIGLMKIPGFTGAIPHYIIYGRDGQLVKTVSGWSDLEAMTRELDKVLAK